MKTVQPTGGYFIGGASLGGLLGYEIAQQLAQMGERTDLLFLIDTPSPEHYPKKLPTDSDIVRYMLEVGAQHIPSAEFAEYSLDDQLDYFLKHAGGLGQALPHFDQKHLKHYLEIYKCNIKAMFLYQLKPPYTKDSVVHYYRASVHDRINPDHPEKGWEMLLKDNLKVYHTPGNHITMLLRPFVDVIGEDLAQKIQICMKKSL
jgi:thioesterase domain-containing protein